jgi:hypothetical protein
MIWRIKIFLSPPCVPSKTLCEFLISALYDTCLSNLVFLHSITITILCEELQLRSYSLHNILRLAVTSALFDQLTFECTWKSGSTASRRINLEAAVEVFLSFVIVFFSLRVRRRGSSGFLAEYQVGFSHPRPVRLPSCSPPKSITPLARTTWEKIKLAPPPTLTAFLPRATHNPCQFLLCSTYVPVQKKLAPKCSSSFKNLGFLTFRTD